MFIEEFLPAAQDYSELSKEAKEGISLLVYEGHYGPDGKLVYIEHEKLSEKVIKEIESFTRKLPSDVEYQLFGCIEDYKEWLSQ